MVSVKTAVISGGLTSVISGIGFTTGQLFASVTSIEYEPALRLFRHHWSAPVFTQSVPNGNGFVPPLIVIQIDPLLKFQAGVVLQSGCVITTSTNMGSGSLTETEIGPLIQLFSSSIL